MSNKKFILLATAAFFGAFAIGVANLPPTPERLAAQPKATVNEPVKRQVVRELVKCEDREANLFSFPGMEMSKRAYAQVRRRLLDGDFTPGEREALTAAMNKYDLIVARYRAENPCL